MFIVAAIVFPQSIYCNIKVIKGKYADVIQNNNNKRFVVYRKTEDGCFSEKEIWKAWFVYAPGKMTAYTNSSTVPMTQPKARKCFLF